MRQGILLIEHQPVLAPSGEVMQPYPQRADQPLLPGDGARLLQRDEPGLRQLAPAAPESRRARDPQDGLQVAQSRGSP